MWQLRAFKALLLVSLLLAAPTAHAQLACILPPLLGGITNSIACGPNAQYSGENSAAFGGSSSSKANALAVGANSVADVNAVAVGYMAHASASGSVAIGNGAVATVANTVSFGSAGNERKLVNISAGTVSSTSTDAINGAQLFSTNSSITNVAGSITTLDNNALALNQRLAAIFGGGSSLDANNLVTLPTYSIQGAPYTSVGGAFGAVDAKLTNTDVAITNLSTQINSGGIGLVTQDLATRQIAVGKLTDGTLVDITGTAGTRKLTGLTDGAVASLSTDAVTGNQLFATNNAVAANTSTIGNHTLAIDFLNVNSTTLNQRLAAVFGGGASIDANGVFTAPSFMVLGSSYNNVDGALNALSNRVQANSNNISALQASGGGGGGASLVTQDPSTRVIHVGTSTDGTTVNLRGMIGDRQLTGVANGSVSATSSDAVNGSQLHATNSAVAAAASYATNAATGLANAVGGGASVDAAGNVTNPQLTVQGQTYSTVANAVGAIDTELTSHATTINNVINNLSQAQRYVRVNGTGNAASASGQNAIAIGANTTSSGIDAIAMGTNSTASQDGAIAIGATSQATGRNAIAIGSNAVATGSVAVGVNARASNGGAAFGDNAVATGENSSALGPGATATAPNSVAIGSGSVNTAANTVSVGSGGNERRITNVEAGISPTDAVNVGQLNGMATGISSQITRLDQRIDNTAGGVAMAMALTGSSLPSDKKLAVALNVGAFGGQTALGISQFLRVNDNVVVSGGVALQER
ncbi:YadA family autotransporter adhesin [Nitrobacter sp. TKz-YC02]|uniref:YadA family autotransporter adhesin n=1 Tax=Nitrobacter sp. TKz-YC02 TaxID=3398704 RepID=UPI003CF2CAC2